MPGTLFLAREEWEMFHLMPRTAMPLSGTKSVFFASGFAWGFAQLVALTDLYCSASLESRIERAFQLERLF